ncbi:hypothetical protein OSJ16_09240 [Mycobacterium ulcerans]
MDEANSGALADASAARRASAMSGSSGTLTTSDVAASSTGLSATMSTPQPTTNTPSATDCAVASPPTSEVRSAAVDSAPNDLRCRSTIEPSPMSTTASVALSASTNSIAMYS